MEKDFDNWGILKKEIELRNNSILFKEGEVWWTHIGVNIKHESCGKGKNFRRPVLVIKKLSSETCIVLPISTQIKNGNWFCSYELGGNQYCALLYQIRMLHVNRFSSRKGKIADIHFFKIKKMLRELLNI